jgi:DNA-directed RNA polymerase specialized sigma24 family protein
MNLHGYTLHDIHDRARAAAIANRTNEIDMNDLIAAAWDKIVDLLLDTDTTPTARDIACAGKTGVQRAIRAHRQTYGYQDRDGFAGAGSAPRFARYWTQPDATPYVDTLIENIALDQVWDAISDRDRAVITALAVCGDYESAAASLNMPPGSLRSYISQARRRYLLLWHEGETPSKPHGYNRRHRNVPLQPCGTHAAFRRHKLHGEYIDDACRAAASRYEATKKGRVAA